MLVYNRPKLEDFIEDTIPPVRYFLTEYFFERVTQDTLGLLEEGAGRAVLDVASGMGIDSCILAGRGFCVLSMEPMARMVGFSRKYHAERGQCSHLFQGYAEEIPLRSDSVDQVLCKGSLDHFLDPRAALGEMRRVLKPGGRIVAAIANYDSLSCYLSRAVFRIQKRGKPPHPDEPRPHHEMPSDHVTRFNAKLLRKMMGEYFAIKKELGVGMFWGAPYANLFFDRLSKPVSRAILKQIYIVARYFPAIADMSVLVGVKANR